MAASLAILFGIFTMLVWGTANTVMKRFTEKIGTYHSVLYRTFISTLFLLIVTLITFKTVLIPLNTLLIMIGIGILSFIAYSSFVKGIEIGKASIITPLSYSYIILTVILSVFFFKESLKLLQIIAMVIIIAGIILISFKYSELKKSKKRRLVKGLGFAAIAALGWGFVFFLWKIPLSNLNPLMVAFHIEFWLFLIALLFAAPLKKKIIIPKMNKSTVLFALIIGVMVAAGSWFYSSGINLEMVSLIAPIVAAGPLVTVITSMIFLKEKLELNQKIAAALIIIGLVAIAL